MSQTSYTINQSAARPGLEADSAIVSHIKTLVSTTLTAPFGYYVALHATPGQFKAPLIATDVTDTKVIGGLVTASHSLESPRSATTTHPAYQPYDSVPVMMVGRMWVRVEEAVDHTSDSVYVRFTATGHGRGALGSTAGSTPDRSILPNARWITTAAANGLAVVEISLPF